MHNNIEIEDIKILRGDWLHKATNMTSPFQTQFLVKNDDFENHFPNKESKFGYKNKDYLQLWIFCKNLDDGIVEMKKQIEKYSYLEVLYAVAIGSKGQDWRSRTFKYGNAIHIVFIQ